MPPKRKNDVDISQEPATAREKKKQKVAFARTIAVQSITPAPPPSNAVAGPSRISTTDSLKGLPSAIDVEKFAEARAFEIDAMQKAMKSAGASSTHRAWQALPRHLRRRAASHDVRRVPLRLRDKARAEMDPVRRKALGRSQPKLGKARRISRTESFLKRQRDKTWLETHIWHAKRMHMEHMWGYRLATHPTEKAFRPSHRASVHGSILHDASYYSLIELRGPEKVLKMLLGACCDPQGPGPGARRFLTGARVLETHLYKPATYPSDLIAPITVIWKPSCLPLQDPAPNYHVEPESAVDPSPTNSKRKRKGKGKGKETSAPAVGAAISQVDENVTRTVWVRSHPAVFTEVFSTLKDSTSITLDAIKQATCNAPERKGLEVELTDLRERVNVFEIMGPKANQVLKGALTPVAEDNREEFRKFWSALADLQTSGSVPRGMVISFKVHDPRLKHPPKNAKPRTTESSSQYLSPVLATFPSTALAQSEIWAEGTRESLRKPRYTKKDLDQRRSKNLVPGTALPPLRQDDRIPILLIQRSLETPSTHTTSSSPALHGWTLVLPAGWGMPFFSSLTHTGTRVGGQRERLTQAFEAGTLAFPRDFPTTRAYEAYAAEREEKERKTWERKPPAKRPNWDKLGTRSPWRADWEVVLGLQKEQVEGDFVATQREAEMEVEEDSMRPWLLRGAEVRTIIESANQYLHVTGGLVTEINRLRALRNHAPLDTRMHAELVKSALVMVRLGMCGRGAPDDLAVIYSIDDLEAKRWKGVMEQKRGRGGSAIDEETPTEIEVSKLVPSKESIIGYVTTGNYSLSRGEGFSIGAVALAQLFRLKDQAQRLGTPQLLFVKVRDRDGIVCRGAQLEVFDT